LGLVVSLLIFASLCKVTDDNPQIRIPLGKFSIESVVMIGTMGSWPKDLQISRILLLPYDEEDSTSTLNALMRMSAKINSPK